MPKKKAKRKDGANHTADKAQIDAAATAIADAISGRHRHLLDKVKNNETLSRTELKELRQYEAGPAVATDELAPMFGADQILTTQKEAAAYVGVDVRTIRRWVEGGMPRTDQGCYLKPLLVAWKTKGNGVTDESDQARAKKAEADLKERKARLLQHQVEKYEGEFIRRDTLEPERIARAKVLHKRFSKVGRTVESKLPDVTVKVRKRIRELIDAEITEAIEDFARPYECES